MINLYLRLLTFPLAVLIPACESSSLLFCKMYSAYKLNKQGGNIQPWCTPFQYWTSPLSMSSSNCCFLTGIQVSQESGKVVWYSPFFKNFQKKKKRRMFQFVVIHTKALHGQRSRRRCSSGTLLLSTWSNKYQQFDHWFLCLFETQLVHLEVLTSCTAEAWLEGFWA